MYFFFIRSAQFHLQFFLWLFLIRKVTCSAETNIVEHDDYSSQSHDWLLFSVDEFHYLNAARVGSSTANNDFDCTFKCLRNPFCLSINLAASRDANGKLWCELLSSERYRNSLDYRENKTSHHLFLLENRIIYYQNMTPSWLKAYASYIDRHHFSTTEKLTFNTSLLDYAALLKVPIIPADIMDDSSLVTVKIAVSLDEDIAKNEDSDPFFGVSDGVSFLGFVIVDEENLNSGYAPCIGTEGTSGDSFSGTGAKRKYSPRPNDSIYLGQFVITLKLNEHWGSCYTAHDGGFVKTAYYNKRLMLSKGVTLEVYKGDKSEKVGIKFMEVTVM